MLKKELIEKVNEILSGDSYLNKKDGVYIYEFCPYYNDTISDSDIKLILDKESRDDKFDKFYEIIEDGYEQVRDEVFYEYRSKICSELDNQELEYDNDDIIDYLNEVLYFEYPYSHFMDTTIYANLLLDVGDANYDFSVNDLRFNDDEEIADESAILWVAKQQGYSKEQLQAAIFRGEFGDSKFLETIQEEVDNAYYMNAFTFLFKMTLGELMEFDKENIESIKIDKCTNCGLVDFWYGAGGPIGVVLEKDIEVPSKFIDSFTYDGGRGQHSIDGIYGPTREIWNGSYTIERKSEDNVDGKAALLSNINETVNAARIAGHKVEINNICNYISVKHDVDEYFFQNEEAEMLEEEYKNSCVYDDITFEEYLLYVSQSW